MDLTTRLTWAPCEMTHRQLLQFRKPFSQQVKFSGNVEILWLIGCKNIFVKTIDSTHLPVHKHILPEKFVLLNDYLHLVEVASGDYETTCVFSIKCCRKAAAYN